MKKAGLARRAIGFWICVLMVFGACKLPLSLNENARGDLALLADWMTGSFNSYEQSVQDTDFYNIHLEMVRIWPERKDGYWLYVEQAASWALEKPYRQRVYHLTGAGGDLLESSVFLIEKPLRFAGCWNTPVPLEPLTPDSLVRKEGCSIFLELDGPVFRGNTRERDCPSDLRGASYATSEVVIERDRLTSWDRGFDDAGVQVWGAVKGPYIFEKQE